MKRIFLTLCLMALSLPAAYAYDAFIPKGKETVSGKVVSIADGDTLTILAAGNTQIKVRLSYIDAPEKGQAFGNRSRQTLSDLCFGKVATVLINDYDRYKRALGEVTCDGVNANVRMVEMGMAWVYRQYSKDARLLQLEEQARAQRLGLWNDREPVPPWEFRSEKRKR
jgi:endonuclease YncB( thermonuclease family)